MIFIRLYNELSHTYHVCKFQRDTRNKSKSYHW